MVARVTLAEVDAVRTSMDAALDLFRTSVVPALQQQQGYEGCYVLTTPDGKALVMTFWSDETAADAGLESGYYAEQVRKFGTFFRSPPGRETYEVGIAEVPQTSRSDARA
jgi:heme-degrading monooxygenase HmoA